jgi:hypothetical protein
VQRIWSAVWSAACEEWAVEAEQEKDEAQAKQLLEDMMLGAASRRR